MTFNFTPQERRILAAALRAQKKSIDTRMRHVTLNTKRETIDNLNADLQITNNLIATLQQLLYINQ